jgi:hypothetical protein
MRKKKPQCGAHEHYYPFSRETCNSPSLAT